MSSTADNLPSKGRGPHRDGNSSVHTNGHSVTPITEAPPARYSMEHVVDEG
jgi:hypothetical protein